MFNKLILATIVTAGSFFVASPSSKAGDCHYGPGYGMTYRAQPTYRVQSYRPAVGIYPTYGVYRAPAYRYVTPGYRPYTTYRPNYIGPSVRFGYGGYGYGYGYPRRGISIGIGF